MNEERHDTIATAPYPSWVTLKRFIGELAKKSLPSRIDQTVMAGRSGGTQSSIRGALRFLGLIDEDFKPTIKFRGLVAAYEMEDWEVVLEPIVMTAYAQIIDGLAFETGTAQQLADHFRKRGKVSGNTLTMAVRFFLAALDDAGVKRSPYFEPPKRPPKKKQMTAPKKKPTGPGLEAATPESAAPDTTKTQPAPADWPSHPFHIPTRRQPVMVTAPRNLREQEWDLIDTFMRGMISLRPREDKPGS